MPWDRALSSPKVRILDLGYKIRRQNFTRISVGHPSYAYVHDRYIGQNACHYMEQ